MPLRVNWRTLATGLAKIVANTGAGNAPAAITGAIDTTAAFTWDGAAPPTAEEGAQLLLQRATYAAAMRVIADHARNAPALAAQADPREMEAELSGLAFRNEVPLALQSELRDEAKETDYAALRAAVGRATAPDADPRGGKPAPRPVVWLDEALLA